MGFRSLGYSDAGPAAQLRTIASQCSVEPADGILELKWCSNHGDLLKETVHLAVRVPKLGVQRRRVERLVLCRYL